MFNRSFGISSADCLSASTRGLVTYITTALKWISLSSLRRINIDCSSKAHPVWILMTQLILGMRLSRGFFLVAASQACSENYLSNIIDAECFSLICHITISSPKRGNCCWWVENNLSSVHSKHEPVEGMMTPKTDVDSNSTKLCL